jgi:hypothetical protein
VLIHIDWHHHLDAACRHACYQCKLSLAHCLVGSLDASIYAPCAYARTFAHVMYYIYLFIYLCAHVHIIMYTCIVLQYYMHAWMSRRQMHLFKKCWNMLEHVWTYSSHVRIGG